MRGRKRSVWITARRIIDIDLENTPRGDENHFNAPFPWFSLYIDLENIPRGDENRSQATDATPFPIDLDNGQNKVGGVS